MLEWLIGFYTLYTAIKIYVSVMQIGYVNDEKRKAPVLMGEARYRVAGNYAAAKEKVALAEHFVDYLLFLWWVLKGFAWLWSLLPESGEVVRAVVFVSAFAAINYLVTLPFEIYRKFKLDKAFGFSKETPRLFVVDQLKAVAMFAIFGGGVTALLAWIVGRYETWWLWGFVLVLGVVLLINIVYPTLIAPFFNTFEPLPEGELRRKIEKMMQEAGLRSDGIFVMDASRRDNRLNAYFGGLGKTKRVVLFDTLLEKLSDEELLAVLGHELGHFSHGDIWKNIALTAAMLFAVFFLFGHLPDALFLQMGVAPEAGVKIALLVLLLSPVSFFFVPVISFVSRHNEYAADRHGAEVGGREHLVDALLKLVEENKSFPKSHPLTVFFYHTHPPILKRLEALGYDPEKEAEAAEEEPRLPEEGIFAFVDTDSDASQRR